MLPEVGQLHRHKGRRRRRDEHLAAVAGGGDASSAVHVVADVALLGQQRSARVQACSHANGAGLERLGHRQCGCGGAGSRREREEERVALRVDLDAALAGAGLADHATVLGQSVRVRVCSEVVEQTCRALDVGEEERDRAGGEVGAHGFSRCARRVAAACLMARCARRFARSRRARAGAPS